MYSKDYNKKRDKLTEVTFVLFKFTMLAVGCPLSVTF